LLRGTWPPFGWRTDLYERAHPSLAAAMAPKCAKPATRRMTKKTTAVCKRIEATETDGSLKHQLQGSTAMEVLSKIAEQHRCPISQQLLVDPVMAEDGHIYERRAIVQWFLKKKASPTTNKPIGDKLVPAVAARQTVGELVEQGMVGAEASFNFFLERGRVRATRVGCSSVSGPDLEGAAADFQRALGAAADPEQKMAAEFQLKALAWMREGSRLAAEVHSMGQQQGGAGQDIRDWMLELGGAARAVVTAPFLQEHRLTEWQDLPKGTRVRILNDSEELRRLCERPPPGAEESVKWVSDMQAWVGAVCTVLRQGDENHKNYVLVREDAPGDRTFCFPYDALLLLNSP